MQPFPDTPPIEGVSDLTGHLWVQEWVTGGALRFQVAPSGLLTFGTRDRTFEAGDALPLRYRSAVTHVRERLDRDALRAAADDPASITFFGIATWNEGVDYDWERLPPFLGVDVWTAARGAYLAPDAAAGVYDRLGLSSLPAIEKETPAAHVDLGRYATSEGLPDSAWSDDPVAGALVRDKAGGRALATRSDLPDPDADPSVDAVVDRYVTSDRIDRAIDALTAADGEPTADAIIDRVVDSIAREAHAHLFRDGDPVVPWSAVRSAVAERVQRYWRA